MAALQSKKGDDLCLKRQAMDNGFLIRHAHVKLAPNAELAREIDARLYRKTGVREDLTPIMRFKVVNVGSIAMNLFPDRMARTMNEKFAVPSFTDLVPTDIIDFPSTGKSSCRQLCLDKRYGGIAPLSDMFKNQAML